LSVKTWLLLRWLFGCFRGSLFHELKQERLISNAIAYLRRTDWPVWPDWAEVPHRGNHCFNLCKTWAKFFCVFEKKLLQAIQFVKVGWFYIETFRSFFSNRYWSHWTKGNK
jgi:hypothetical protein